jgi:hypothetical protein
MSQITVYPNQSTSFFNAKDALINLGWDFVGDFSSTNPVNRIITKYSVFHHPEHDGAFYFKNMDHYNTTIYKIVLKKLPKPLGHYDAR